MTYELSAWYAPLLLMVDDVVVLCGDVLMEVALRRKKCGWMMQEGEERGRRGIIRKGWAWVDPDACRRQGGRRGFSCEERRFCENCLTEK